MLVYLLSIVEDYFWDTVENAQITSGMISKEMVRGVPQRYFLGLLL